MATIAPINIRDRLTALNTKAYYLLVALAFIYIQSPHTPLLNWALTLTAAVAVLPVQDFFKSAFWLEVARAFKIVCLLLALFLTLWWAWSSHPAPVNATNKPAPAQAQPAQQQNSKEPAIDSESRLRTIEEKADHALMEKDYIERIQKEVKDYYDKAFLTQLAIVTIIGLFVAAAGKFGVDHIVQSKLTQLERTFDKRLEEERQKLEKSNSDQIQRLKEATEKTVNALARDAKTRSNYQFHFSQGLTLAHASEPSRARRQYRLALAAYKMGKTGNILVRDQAVTVLKNIFGSLRAEDKTTYVGKAREELARKRYSDLEEELAQTALEIPWLGPLVLERQESTSATQELPAPALDKAQPTKPDQGE